MTPKLSKIPPRAWRAAAQTGEDEPVAAPAEPLPGALGALRALVDEAAARIGGPAAFLLGSGVPGRFGVAAASEGFPAPPAAVVTLDGERMRAEDDDGEGTALLTVPVTLHGVPLGVLCALPSTAAGGAVSVLEAVRQEAAAAAAVARVGEAERQLTELGAIVEVGQVLTGLLDMRDVLSYLVYLAESLVGGHAATVALMSDDGRELVLGNSTGSLRGREGQPVPLQGSLIGWVAEHGEPLLIRSVSDDPRSFSLGMREGPGVVVPIAINGRTLGVFLVSRADSSPPFTEESVAMLQKLAAYAAIAIANAETHRSQREAADELRAQAAELEAAYTELRRSQEQLLVSEKMAALGRITAGIAHEINSPLGGILNSLRTARGFVDEYRTSVGDPEVTAEDHHAIADDLLGALATAESAVTKVAQFVRSIKGQTRGGEGASTVFDPAAEVEATAALLQHELRRRKVALFTDMERGHRLTGDQGKFGVVIQNLISNAMDAYEDQPGEIWVRIHEGDDGALRVAVEDRGSGIPEEIRGRIFDYLFTTKEVGKGTGLGLAMVHNVVTAAFRGEVSLESEVGQGTTFTLTLPLDPTDTDHGA